MALHDDPAIEHKMHWRRIIAARQTAADVIKSKICNDIAARRTSVVGLPERIARLSLSDPELFSYIRDLEYVKHGIWCDVCEKMKDVGVDLLSDHPTYTGDARQQVLPSSDDTTRAADSGGQETSSDSDWGAITDPAVIIADSAETSLSALDLLG